VGAGEFTTNEAVGILVKRSVSASRLLVSSSLHPQTPSNLPCWQDWTVHIHNHAASCAVPSHLSPTIRTKAKATETILS
jgi:hypothetical protein